MNEDADTLDRATPPSSLRPIRWQHVLPGVVLLTLVLGGLIAFETNDRFHDEVLVLRDVLASGDQAQIREYLKGFGAWAPAVSVLLMGLQAVFAPVPASVVQLANGVVFGLLPGTLLNIAGQLLGAVLAFSISRAFGQSAAERFVGRIDDKGVIEARIDAWSGWALVLVRAVPGMPSDFVSYIMGLTRMSLRRYTLLSMVGYVPQSFAYAWLGDAATEYFWWIIAAGFGASGVLGIVVWIVRKVRSRQPSVEVSAEVRGDSC